MHQPMIHLHPQVQYIWFALHTETGTNHAIQVSIVAPLVIWEVQVPISAAKVQIWWDSYYQHTVWNLSVALIRVLCQYSDNWYASRPTTDIVKGKISCLGEDLISYTFSLNISLFIWEREFDLILDDRVSHFCNWQFLVTSHRFGGCAISTHTRMWPVLYLSHQGTFAASQLILFCNDTCSLTHSRLHPSQLPEADSRD